MTGFTIRTQEGFIMHFHYYHQDAPITVNAFHKVLPFTRDLIHARYSGEEIWTANGPHLDIIQENASIYIRPGEVVIGPSKPSRVATCGALGIYYGEGKGVDSCNIFACIIEADRQILRELGQRIWMSGQQTLFFEPLE